MKCCIVKDLLPGYIDGLTSEETNMEIKEHLESCADCRTIYEQMSAELPSELTPEEKDIDFLKKWKRRIWQGYAAAAIFAFGIAVLLIRGVGGHTDLFNFWDSFTLEFILIPCGLILLCTKSLKAFGRAFLLAFGKGDAPLSSYRESLLSVRMVMSTAPVFGGIGFIIGMSNCIRSMDFSAPDAFVWILRGAAAAMVSLLYPLLICVILLPLCFMLKKHIDEKNR